MYSHPMEAVPERQQATPAMIEAGIEALRLFVNPQENWSQLYRMAEATWEAMSRAAATPSSEPPES